MWAGAGGSVCPSQEMLDCITDALGPPSLQGPGGLTPEVHRSQPGDFLATRIGGSLGKVTSPLWSTVASSVK